MTPDQKLALMALTNITQALGNWPVVSLLVIVLLLVLIGPWIVVYLLSKGHDSQAAAHDLRSVEMIAGINAALTKALNEQAKRFEAVTQMYKDNVLLVENYEKMASEVLSITHLCIQGMTKLVEKIDNNMFCPVVRERGPNRGD